MIKSTALIFRVIFHNDMKQWLTKNTKRLTIQQQSRLSVLIKVVVLYLINPKNFSVCKQLKSNQIKKVPLSDEWVGI